MTYYGELLAISTALSWAIGIFPFTEATRRMGAHAVNHLRLLLAAIVLAVIAVSVYAISPADLLSLPSSASWFWLGLSGFVGLTLGDYFGFTMFAILGGRTGSIFSTLAPGVALLFGLLLLGETINIAAFAGMLITVGGILWLSLNRKEQDVIRHNGYGSLRKGIIFGVLAAVCQGAGLVFAKKGMDAAAITAVHATWMRMATGTGSLYIMLLAAGRIRDTLIPLKGNRPGISYTLAGTVFGPVAGVWLSLETIRFMQVSIAQTIFSMVPVIAIPLAYLFYRERPTLRSIYGALVAIGGVMILIWRDHVTEGVEGFLEALTY